MKTDSKRRKRVDAYVPIRALAHPIRVQIIEVMGRNEMSTVEISRQMPDYSVSRLAYHVRVLADAGVLYRTRRRQVRGAIETFYRAGLAARELSAIFRDFENVGRWAKGLSAGSHSGQPTSQAA